MEIVAFAISSKLWTELTECTVNDVLGKNLLVVSQAPNRLEHLEHRVEVGKAKGEREAKRVVQDPIPRDHKEVQDQRDPKVQVEVKEKARVLAGSSVKASVRKARSVRIRTSLEESQGVPLLGRLPVSR